MTGGGRKKEDPEMEENVFAWLLERFHSMQLAATRNQIRGKALELSNRKDRFKASKGWLEKFFTRYNCKHMLRKEVGGSNNSKTVVEENIIAVAE